jgi:release factor glutamine methyltransferase
LASILKQIIAVFLSESKSNSYPAAIPYLPYSNEMPPKHSVELVRALGSLPGYLLRKAYNLFPSKTVRGLDSNQFRLNYCISQHRSFSTKFIESNEDINSKFQVTEDTFLNCGSFESSTSSSKLSTPISINDAYKECIKLFDRYEIPESEHSARYLISKVASIPYRYSAFLKSLDKSLDSNHIHKLIEYVNRRLLREPIQYILGDWDFCGMILLCKAPVLIPRPETEDLVNRIIERLQNYKVDNNNRNSWNRARSDQNINRNFGLQILDIGAGSGAIGLGLLKHIKDATCTAIDLNDSAVRLSLENARQNNLINRYNCYNIDCRDFLHDKKNCNRFDIIVSNPPYIPSADIPNLSDEVRKFEDIRALDGGSSGLDIIEDIILNCYPLFSEHGTKELWLEVSDSHPDCLQTKYDGVKLKDQNVHLEVLKLKDLYDLPRFVVVKYKNYDREI